MKNHKHIYKPAQSKKVKGLIIQAWVCACGKKLKQ